MEGENIEKARQIISYVVDRTKITVGRYQGKFPDLDRVFITRGYEQGGFQIFKLTPLLEAQGIFSIDKIGSILDTYEGKRNITAKSKVRYKASSIKMRRVDCIALKVRNSTSA